MFDTLAQDLRAVLRIAAGRGSEPTTAIIDIANVDVRPGVTREKIVNGNPFMKNFTAKDLKTWAELKMQGLNLASH